MHTLQHPEFTNLFVSRWILVKNGFRSAHQVRTTFRWMFPGIANEPQTASKRTRSHANPVGMTPHTLWASTPLRSFTRCPLPPPNNWLQHSARYPDPPHTSNHEKKTCSCPSRPRNSNWTVCKEAPHNRPILYVTKHIYIYIYAYIYTYICCMTYVTYTHVYQTCP